MHLYSELSCYSAIVLVFLCPATGFQFWSSLLRNLKSSRYFCSNVPNSEWFVFAKRTDTFPEVDFNFGTRCLKI
jgi:hypothetical protein